MKERADLIKLYVSNGITSLDAIKKDYNSFGDGGYTNPTTTIKPLSYTDVILKTVQSKAKLNSVKSPKEPLPPNTKIITDSNGNEFLVRTEESLQDVTSSIMEWTPGVGDVYELGLIGNDFKQGNYGSAALGAGLFFIPGNARKLIDKGKSLLGLNSRKASKNATEKVKALLKRFPKGMDSSSHFSASLKERLLKEGVDPKLLTDDNLKKMTYLRSQDILESATPSKFAARESSSGINMYNLYNTVDGGVTQVGYINAVPNPTEKSGRIAMVENVTQGSRKPVKGVSELGYNTVIKDLGASENGRVLLHPESTIPVLDKYKDKDVIGNYGVWYINGSQTLGNPVYRLNTPTYDVPIKYLDDFSVEGLDDSGMFLFDFTKGPLLKNGGKLNKKLKIFV